MFSLIWRLQQVLQCLWRSTSHVSQKRQLVRFGLCLRHRAGGIHMRVPALPSSLYYSYLFRAPSSSKEDSFSRCFTHALINLTLVLTHPTMKEQNGNTAINQHCDNHLQQWVSSSKFSKGQKFSVAIWQYRELGLQ